MKRTLATSVLLLLLITLQGCAVNPVTGKNEFSLVSENQEISMGQENFAPSQQMEGGVYNIDPLLTGYINDIGQKLAAVSDRQLPYEFVVLNNSVPNAWALPGGKIAVNRGLLLELENEAELAAVLGHEIVHAAARHGAQAMSRGIFLQGALLAASLSLTDHEYSNYIIGAASLGAQLVNQRYGRDDELEADYYGMLYMARAGYNPDAAVTLQETFVRLAGEQKQNWLEGLFASHPPSADRVHRNRQTRLELTLDGTLGTQSFDTHMAMLNKRRPAYAAMDKAGKEIANKQFDQAHQSIDQAITMESAEARFFGLKAEIYQSQGQYNLAQLQYEEALARNPDWFQYYLGRGLNYIRQGNVNRARMDLEKSNSLLPTAIAMNELGKIALTSGQRNRAKEYFQGASGAAGPVGEEASRAFIQLDVVDFPASYLKSNLYLDDNQHIIIYLENRAPVAMKNISILLVKDGGQSLLREIKRLEASTAANLDTGIEVVEEQELARYTSVIRNAVPLNQAGR